MNSYAFSNKEQSQLYQAIISTTTDAVLAIDEESVIIFANQSLGDMFGYYTNRLIGENLEILIPEYLQPVHRAAMKRYIRTGEKHIPWRGIVLPGLHKDGTEIMLEITFNEFFLDNKRMFAGIIHNITERRQIEEGLNALKSFISEVQNSKDTQSVLQLALSKICKAARWCYGEVWLPSVGEVLVPSPVWYGDKRILGEFRAETEKFTFSPDAGFPGRIWSSKKKQVITDIDAVDKVGFVRIAIAKKTGLRSGYGVPILSEGKVVAIMTFFMFHTYSDKDKKFEDLVDAVATKISIEYERRQTEEKLRQKEEHFKAIVDTATDAIISIDENSIIFFANYAAENIFGYKNDELLDKTITLIMPEYLRATHPGSIKDMVDNSHAMNTDNIELFGQHKSGKIIPLEMSFREFALDGKRFYASIIRSIKYHKI